MGESKQDKKKQQEETLTLDAPTQTPSGKGKLEAMNSAEKEESAKKKQSILIQSEDMDKIFEAYKKHCLNKTPPQVIKDEDLKAKDGKASLNFDSPEDMTKFLKSQAEDKQRFVVIDAQTNKVLAYSNGDGEIYRPGAKGGPPEKITDKSNIMPTESEMKDLPDHSKFTMPEPSSAPQLK